MHYRFYQLLVVLAVSLIASAINYAQTPIATMVSYKGPVLIKPSKSGKWDSTMKSLRLGAGDSIKLGKKAKATVLYLNGKEIRLTSGEIHCVTTAKQKHINSKIATVLEWLFEQETPLPHGISRGTDKPPVLIYPRYGQLLSNRPAFAWLSSAAGTEYVIELFNEEDSLIWKSIQKDTVLKYPAEAPQLIDGATYQVEISRQFKDGAEDYGDFAIASTADSARMVALQQEIKSTYKSAVTSDIIYAASLMKEEFFTEALRVLQEALKKQPDNRAIRTMLAQIYEQVGPPLLIKPMLK